MSRFWRYIYKLSPSRRKKIAYQLASTAGPALVGCREVSDLALRHVEYYAGSRAMHAEKESASCMEASYMEPIANCFSSSYFHNALHLVVYRQIDLARALSE